MANENKYYSIPFAESGERQDVPNESVGGNVAYDTGYGSDYELAQGDPNRKRIPRGSYNEMWNGVTKNIKQIQESNFPTWIEDAGEGTPFPYGRGAVVVRSGITYISLVDDNVNEPEVEGWEEFNLADVGGTGKAQVTKVIEESEDYIPPSDVIAIKFQLVGGGGGGGAAAGGDDELTSIGISAAGGGGGYCEFTDDEPREEYTITVGDGGLGGESLDFPGENGGDTIVTASGGLSLNSKGGIGGDGGSNQTDGDVTLGGSGGGAFGGSINIRGGRGTTGRRGGEDVVYSTSSGRGSVLFGGGSTDTNKNGTATNGSEWGAAGSGCVGTIQNQVAGGDGFQGVVIITEYF